MFSLILALVSLHSTFKSFVNARGGGFFHGKGTWGCAAREGILFRTSSLAKGVLFGNFSRVKSRQEYAFWEFWSKRYQNSVIFAKWENLASFAKKMPIQSTSERKISLAKGIIFTKIGLANGYIVKLWAAPPTRNLAENPPPPCVNE